MYKTLSAISFALLLTASPALAQFEGTLEMKMTVTDPAGASQGGGHSIKFAIGKAGTRSEMNMQAHQMAMKMVVLQQTDKPDIIYRINDDNKTYTEIDLAKSRDPAAQTQDNAKYIVRKLGEEKLLGYPTLHVLVKALDPAAEQAVTTTEMWLAKDFGDYDRFSRLNARPGARKAGEAGLAKALKDAGANGIPLKTVTTAEGGVKVTTEVVKVDKQALPASTFEIPAGYTKSAGGMMGGMSGPQADEARKRMQDAMKNMTPEQREKIEQMINQHHGAPPAGAPQSP